MTTDKPNRWTQSPFLIRGMNYFHQARNSGLIWHLLTHHISFLWSRGGQDSLVNPASVLLFGLVSASSYLVWVVGGGWVGTMNRLWPNGLHESTQHEVLKAVVLDQAKWTHWYGSEKRFCSSANATFNCRSVRFCSDYWKSLRITSSHTVLRSAKVENLHRNVQWMRQVRRDNRALGKSHLFPRLHSSSDSFAKACE